VSPAPPKTFQSRRETKDFDVSNCLEQFNCHISVELVALIPHTTAKNGFGGYVVTEEFETTRALISPDDYQTMLKVEAALGWKSSKVFPLAER
jgi:hypothetical protein